MVPDPNTQTESILSHYLKALVEENIDAILSDYSEDAILFTSQGPQRGVEEIRKFFAGFLKNRPRDFMKSFQVVRQDIEREIAFIVWKAGKDIPLGTDTFIVRKGKILVHTFLAMMPPVRLSERIAVDLEAVLFSGGKTFEGSIKNVSESGIGYLITSEIRKPKEFTPKRVIELSFKNPSGELFHLDCEIVWFHRPSPVRGTVTLGMKLIDPPEQYKDFVKKLGLGRVDKTSD